jgi:chemotaxis protein MotC
MTRLPALALVTVIGIAPVSAAEPVALPPVSQIAPGGEPLDVPVPDFVPRGTHVPAPSAIASPGERTVPLPAVAGIGDVTAAITGASPAPSTLAQGREIAVAPGALPSSPEGAGDGPDATIPVSAGGTASRPVRIVGPAVAVPQTSLAQNQTDDLLGDPAFNFVPPSQGMEPVTAAPASIGLGAPTPLAAAPLRGPETHVTALPFELVRTLQMLQDQMADGATGALSAQQALRVEIDRAFAAADVSLWQNPRNAEAAVTFVLNGGAPTILKVLATLNPPPAVDLRLVNGVLAYAEGREADAAAQLAGINPLDLPPSMAAQVALAQSALVVAADPGESMRLLSLARLLAPGTLVEEAAIRRQLFIADQLKDTDEVESLARQYLDRFRHSIYAGNFRARFAAAVSHMDFIDNEAEFPRLDDILATVGAEARGELYLTVALASVVNGRVTAARLAAERAAGLAPEGSPEAARAGLYIAAALVADPQGLETATADLDAVDAVLLGPSDRALRNVVAITLGGVRTATDAGPAEPAESGDPTPPTPVMTRAADALGLADALLEKASQ